MEVALTPRSVGRLGARLVTAVEGQPMKRIGTFNVDDDSSPAGSRRPIAQLKVYEVPAYTQRCEVRIRAAVGQLESEGFVKRQ